MTGSTQIELPGMNKIKELTNIAIMRLREFAPKDIPYYGAYSGGKDSDCVKRLSLMAGVPVEWHYSQGGIDPPELVQHIRKDCPDVIFDRPPMSVWKGVMLHGMPRRQARWCCELIKEKHGSGRRVITGIRWQESPRRRLRPMFQYCGKDDKTKSFLNPIIDWTSKDVWDFIHAENIPYCSLYDEGFKRLGCVLCPMQTPKQTQIELTRWPKLAGAWKRACYRYWNETTHPGVKRWDTPEKMWQWWLSRKGGAKVNDAQCIMFDN